MYTLNICEYILNIFVSCSLKSRSDQGCKAVQAETEERTKMSEELRGIREWLASAGIVLAELERGSNTERLQVGLFYDHYKYQQQVVE